MIKYADRVFQTTTTAGTGTINLAAGPVGFRTFVAGVGSGAIVPYHIEDGTDWESGIGMVTAGSPDTLTRSIVLESSNSDALVNFGSNVKNVRLSANAKLFQGLDENLNDQFGLGVAGGTATAHTLDLFIQSRGLSNTMRVLYRAPAANASGAFTLNVEGHGAKPVKWRGQDIPANTILAGDLIDAVYIQATDTYDLRGLPGALLDLSKSLSSAATVSLAGQTCKNVTVTGTTTITSFGTSGRTGQIYKVKFPGALTLTHNATSLIIPGGANYTTKAGDTADIEDLGSNNWKVTLTGKRYIHVQEQQTSGGGGGNFSTGAWRKRTLNTVVFNNIPGASFNTGTGVLTLPAGTYEGNFWALGYQVEMHRTRVQNTADNTTVALGSNAYSDNSTRSGPPSSGKTDRFTLTAAKTFELQHQCSSSNTSFGFGYPSSMGVEIYSELYIEQIVG